MRTGIGRYLVVGLLMASTAFLTGCQDRFVYYPLVVPEPELLAQARALGIEPWPHAGEERIGWVVRAPARADGEPPHRALVFHGNAGHSLQRRYFADGLRATGRPWDVYLFEYPGYGSRPGRPGEERIVSAAIDAFDSLVADAPSRPVYLFGESLGSGVATQVAAARPDLVGGLILVVPFTNLVDVGATRAPRALVRVVLRDRYDNERALQTLAEAATRAPALAVLLAGRDEIVPAALGKRVYEGYDGPKRLWIEEDAGHNTLDLSPRAAWWAQLTDFALGP